MMEKLYSLEISNALNPFAARISLEREAYRIFRTEDSLLEDLLKQEER